MLSLGVSATSALKAWIRAAGSGPAAAAPGTLGCSRLGSGGPDAFEL